MEVWIGRQGERHGPYQEEQIKQWLHSGQLSPQDLGWYDGLADWQALSVLFPLDKPAPVPPLPNPYAPPATPAEVADTVFDYAGFWQRFGAWVIDLIVLTIPSMIAMYALGGMEAYKHLLDQLQSGADMNSAIRTYAAATQGAQLASLTITFIYYALFEASKLQATPGKLALRLRVTDLHGARLTLRRAAARNIVRLTGMILGLIPLLCYLAVAWTRRRQGWHDLLAGTLVLNGTAQQQPPPQHQPPRRDSGRFDA